MLKTSQITNLQHLLFVFNTKRMVEKLRTVKGWGGPAGPQCLNFSKFALGAKKKFAIQCVGKNKEFTWESNFPTENFVIQLRAKNRSGVFADPPVPRGLKKTSKSITSPLFSKVQRNILLMTHAKL